MREVSVLAPVGRLGAVLLAVLFTVAAACSTPPPAQRTSFEASGDGALEASRPGGMQVKMGPGTFAAGTAVGIDVEKSVPAVAAARLIGEALSLSAPTQPAKPVTLRAKAPEGIDPALVVGVLWSKDRSRPETVPVYLENGYLTALVPHFSVFAFFHFDAIEAFQSWLIDQMQQFFNDFIGQPYQCKTSGANDSKLLRTQSTGLAGILDVGSMDAAANTVRFSICNQRHYFMAYAVDGAGRAAGLLDPRSTTTFDVPVAGHAGDLLNVHGIYSGEARFRTALYLLIAGLPAGSEALKLVSGNDFTELVAALPICIPLASAAPSGASPIDLIKCIVGDRRATEKIITLVTRKLTEAQRLSVEGGAAYGKQALKFLGLLETQALAVRVIVDLLALPPSNVGIAYTLTSAFPARTPTPTTIPAPVVSGPRFVTADEAAHASMRQYISTFPPPSEVTFNPAPDLRDVRANAGVLVHYYLQNGFANGLFLTVVFNAGQGWQYANTLSWKGYEGVPPGIWVDTRGTRAGWLLPSGSCVNIRTAPSLSAGVLRCLSSTGTPRFREPAFVAVDDGPTYADGHVWWRLAGHGWFAHEALMCALIRTRAYEVSLGSLRCSPGPAGPTARLKGAKFFRLPDGHVTDFFIDMVAPPGSGGPAVVHLASRVVINGVVVPARQYGMGAMHYQFTTTPITVNEYPILIVVRTPIVMTGVVELTLLRIVLADGTSQELTVRGTLTCETTAATQGSCEIR